MNLHQAIRLVRKELVIKDEPLKAWNLIQLFRCKELNPEIEKTYGMIRHYFDKKHWDRAYNIPVDNCEQIEPFEFATNAGPRYVRYAWLLNHLQQDKAKSYLDLGCYVGSLVTTAASRGIESYGVDATRGVIEVARDRAKRANVKATFFAHDAADFKDQKAEHVSAFEIIEHTIDPKAFIENMLSISTKFCYISTPDGPYGNGQGNIDGGWEWRGETDYRGHLRVFTQKTMGNLLKEIGCEIAEMQTIDGLLNVKFIKQK